MQIFINDEIFKNGYPVCIDYERNIIRLSIVNLSDVSESKTECVEVEFEVQNECELKENFNGNFHSTVSKVIVRDGKYIFEQGTNSDDDVVYALIRAPKYFEPAEVYISTNDRNKIQVLKQFKFIDGCVVGEKGIGKMYFIKINLPPKNKLTVYFSTVKPKNTFHCIELFNSSFFGIQAKKDILVLDLDEEIRKKYIIALSEL